MKRPTKEQTVKALKESIDKWDKIRLSIRNSPEHPCPLCDLFDVKDAEGNSKSCSWCPIKDPLARSCCNEWSDVRHYIDLLQNKLYSELRKREKRS